MRPLVSCGAEFVCWQQLLTNIEGILQSPWGFVAGVALAEASVEYDWSGQQRVFQGMEHEQMLYMDDGFLWTPTVADLRSRILQLGVVLRSMAYASTSPNVNYTAARTAQAHMRWSWKGFN